MERNFIIEILERENLSNEELADISQVNKSTVYRWIKNGTNNIKLESLHLISHKLNINLEWFFDEKSIYRKSIAKRVEKIKSFRVPIINLEINGLINFEKNLLSDTLSEDSTTELIALDYLDSEPEKYFITELHTDIYDLKELIPVKKGSSLLFKHSDGINNHQFGIYFLNKEIIVGFLIVIEKKVLIQGIVLSKPESAKMIIADKNDEFRIYGYLHSIHTQTEKII